MSVQSEIDRIITAVGNAYSKVSEKGGTVPASQTVANLSTAIDSIPAVGTKETWVIKSDASGVFDTTQIAFTSNGQKYTSIGAVYDGAGTFIILYYDTSEIAGADVMGGGAIFEFYNEADRTITFDTPPTGALLTWLQSNAVKQPDDTAGLELVANVDTGATVTATLGSKTVTGVSVDGQARLKIPQEGKWTVSATIGLLLSVPQEISVPATIDIVLVSQELNDTSWEAIKQVSDANMGASLWSVGDCKQITMNGKVSDGLTLNNYTAWVYIIGFNHNSEREGNGIAFQGFKATKNGTPICLIDSACRSTKSSGTWFNMNNSEANAGGWEACLMRKNIMPLIKASFPFDLKAVIKPSTIYTAPDTGNIALTATQDDVFLLAEYEVFGTYNYASSQEPNYLKQYAYYSAGNSKVNYRHNDTSAVALWWLRSPNSHWHTYFCRVTHEGNSDRCPANYSFGVSPAFKV